MTTLIDKITQVRREIRVERDKASKVLYSFQVGYPLSQLVSLSHRDLVDLYNAHARPKDRAGRGEFPDRVRGLAAQVLRVTNVAPAPVEGPTGSKRARDDPGQEGGSPER